MIFQKVDEGGGGHLGVISVESAFEPRGGGDYWVRERESSQRRGAGPARVQPLSRPDTPEVREEGGGYRGPGGGPGL